jgi:hypothetical protein
MRKLLFLAAAVAFAALTSCGGSGKTDSKTDSTKTKDKTENTGGNGKYKMKSGILTQTMTMMGMTQKVTVYFDDYGNKENKETEADMGMVQMDNISLTLDGYLYSIDMSRKIGTKMKIPKTSNKDIDFNKLTEDMMKSMNITKLGTETVLGKTCDKYSMDDASLKMKIIYCVWDGIPLKMESETMGIKSTLVTTKIDENASVPADKFEIPKDVKITDFDKKHE